MKKTLWLSVFLFLTTPLFAQTNAPVKLALIAETNEVSPAVDVLTATLSGGGKIQLLERDEIEKVYQEQGMSEANWDDLKLGRILGADGLLLLDVVRTPQATNLTARLIAVKPGVVLTDGSFPWPLKDTTQWSESVAVYLDSFLPKLTLLAKDAIPISIVNLRAAVSSTDEQETERELKLLTIQRLSQEQRFFVLERQKMQLLSEEKELKSDESAFWDGSYLLDGTVDQNGYSKETVTVNARLTPPKGGAPLSFEVSGSRTNLSEVINRLAAKVTELLKVNATANEWSATNEAQQYFDEAKWALRWGVYSEAEAAADSAWALGKRDLESAMVRIRSYLLEESADTADFQIGESTLDPRGGYDAENNPLAPPPTDAAVKQEIVEISSEYPLGIAYKIQEANGAKVIDFVSLNKAPDPKSIDRAVHALGLYYEFSQNSSDSNLIEVASAESNWKNSDWYNLGIEDLVAASKVLQNFNFVPVAQKSVADKLADLRALARSVSEWISKLPSVHDSYFVGDRVVTHDELANTIEENPNIFRCKVNWGCFWQEKPEDCVALYRELMSSPVFCYIHNDLWSRKLQTPRLVAWNEEDQKRVPAVWNDFVQELCDSTNVLLRMETKAIQFADVNNERELGSSFTNLFNAIFEHHDALVNDNVEVLYLGWGVGDLVSAKTGNGIATETKDALNHLFYSEYYPKLEAMDQEYWNKTVSAGRFLSVFEKQKQYLKENKPYDFMEFAQLFSSPDYSKAQALEIQPLIVTYKSNLVAQSQTASIRQKGQLMGAIAQVGFLEDDVNRALNPPAPRPQTPPTVEPPKPAPIAKTVITVSVPANAPEVVTNVITVNKFFPIPLSGLIDLSESEHINSQYSRVDITAHHWFEGKLLLDFHYDMLLETFDNKGKLIDNRQSSGLAIAIFDPQTEHWKVAGCPEVDLMTQNNFYHRSVLLKDGLFNCDGGQTRQYDFYNQQWRVLKISDGNNYELFAVNGHLYAANRNVIFEIIDGGKSTRIMASTRRQPPMSALDTQDLGTPTLFEGPNHSLRVCTVNKIFTWTGNDWHEDGAAPPASFSPEIFPGGALFRLEESIDLPLSFYSLSTETTAPKLCLSQKASPKNVRLIRFANPHLVSSEEPLWTAPPGLFFAKLPATLNQSDLYLLENHSKMQEIASDQHIVVQEKVVGEDGCNAVLLCFSDGLSLPQKIFLDFDAPDGCPPSAGIAPTDNVFPVLPPAWMLSDSGFLFFGLENSRNSIPAFNQADRIGIGYKAGVWVLPLSKIESAVAAQRQIQTAKQQQLAVAAAQAHKNLIAKFDLNHNGIIDPDEKEQALDDPAFIESELDTIDANHNGWLDAKELIYFDANKNKILDAKERAGIDIAQHLLAARLLKKFDTDGDGRLNRSEFNNLSQSIFAAKGTAAPAIPFSHSFSTPDDNHDGYVDLVELENYLKEQTRRSLRMHGASGAALIGQNGIGAIPTVNPQGLFKSIVELYWRQHE